MRGIQVFRYRRRRHISIFCFVFVVLVSLVLSGCSHGRALKQGNVLYERGEYAESLESYEEALAAKPSSEEAAAGIARARRRIVRGLIDDGTVALRNDELALAIDHFERAADVPGDYPELYDFSDVLKHGTVELAEAEATNGNYASSLSIYRLSGQSLLGQLHDFETRRVEIAEHWAGDLYRAGLDVSGEGHSGHALLLFAKAAELSGDPRYRMERDQWWRHVRTEITYAVRVNLDVDGIAVAWPGPSFVPGDAGMFQILGDAGGKPADATVLVDPLSATIFHKESTSFVEVEYQSGIRDVPNPNYEYVERKLNGAERRLIDSESEVTNRQSEVAKRQLALERARERDKGDSDYYTRGALRDLESAHNDLERAFREVQARREAVQRTRAELHRTSRTVQEPVYSIYRYPIVTRGSAGSIGVDYVIRHADGRSPIQSSNTLEIEFTDHEHEAHPTIGLSPKYVDIPSDQLIGDRMKRIAVDDVMEGILDSYDGYRSSFLERARNSTVIGETVDGLVRYLLLSSSGKYPVPEETIYEIVGIPDAQKVLLTVHP